MERELSRNVIKTDKLKAFLARRRWQRCGQAIRWEHWHLHLPVNSDHLLLCSGHYEDWRVEHCLTLVQQSLWCCQLRHHQQDQQQHHHHHHRCHPQCLAGSTWHHPWRRLWWPQLNSICWRRNWSRSSLELADYWRRKIIMISPVLCVLNHLIFRKGSDSDKIFKSHVESEQSCSGEETKDSR